MPFAVLPLGSSRHLPDAGLTREPLLPGRHTWLAPPLQNHHSMGVLSLRALAPVMSRPPPIRMVPSGADCQLCAVRTPLHEKICTWVPAVVDALARSMQSPELTRDTIGP